MTINELVTVIIPSSGVWPKATVYTYNCVESIFPVYKMQVSVHVEPGNTETCLTGFHFPSELYRKGINS